MLVLRDHFILHLALPRYNTERHHHRISHGSWFSIKEIRPSMQRAENEKSFLCCLFHSMSMSLRRFTGGKMCAPQLYLAFSLFFLVSFLFHIHSAFIPFSNRWLINNFIACNVSYFYDINCFFFFLLSWLFALLLDYTESELVPLSSFSSLFSNLNLKVFSTLVSSEKVVSFRVRVTCRRGSQGINFHFKSEKAMSNWKHLHTINISFYFHFSSYIRFFKLYWLP